MLFSKQAQLRDDGYVQACYTQTPPWTSLLSVQTLHVHVHQEQETKLNKGERRMACAWIRHIDVMLVSIALHRLGKVRARVQLLLLSLCISICETPMAISLGVIIREWLCSIEVSSVPCRQCSSTHLAAVSHRCKRNIVTLETRPTTKLHQTAQPHDAHSKHDQRSSISFQNTITGVELPHAYTNTHCIRHYHP